MLRTVARMLVVGAILAAFATGPAAGDVSDFLGVWVDADTDTSGIARIVVTPGDGGQVNIRVFGRCHPADCDWGVQPARTYTGDPGSKDVRSIAADFNAGVARKHLTLSLAVGHALRFEVQTDFTDGSARSNYAVSGNVAAAADEAAGAQVAGDATPGADAMPGNGGADLLGGLSIGIGPKLPPGYVPAKGEDCTPFNPAMTHAANIDGSWRLVDFSHRLVNFGPSQSAALKAQAVIAFYHFDEECFVSRDGATMLYWKRAGQVPAAAAAGQDCVALDPGAAKAVSAGGVWTVVAGDTALLAYGDDKAAAERAVSVIRTYRLNRQCFFARPSSAAQYWLSQ
jgi:hypothetical protein